MQPWVVPALAASGCIAFHYLLLRAASGKIGDALGALILEGTATLGILLTMLLRVRADSVATTRWGVIFSALSGIGISAGSILLFMALRKGGPVASTGTIVLGGGVTLSALLAPIFFQEGFSLRRGIGVALGIAAIAVLSREGQG
jgi:uncharacterized membrane protein